MMYSRIQAMGHCFSGKSALSRPWHWIGLWFGLRLLVFVGLFWSSLVSASYDTYCKESGSQSATATCYPAKESAWTYDGGTYNWAVHSYKKSSLEEVIADIENGINAKFPDYCIKATLVLMGDWFESTNNPGSKQDTHAFRIDFGYVAGSGCQSVTGGIYGNSITRYKAYTCAPGSTGPFFGPGGERLCATWRNACPATPHPVSIADGSKQFNAITDSDILSHFEFRRSYSSFISYQRNTLSNLPGNDNQFLGWTTSYDASVIQGSNIAGTITTYTVSIPGEIPRTYVLQGDGSLTSKQADSGALTRGADQRFFFRHPNGRLWVFGSNGKLRSIYHPNGKRISITLGVNNTISQVTDTFGRQLGVTYSPAGQLSVLTDPAGNNFQYLYNAGNRLTAIQYPGLPGETPVKQYLYEDTANPASITGLIDELDHRTDTFGYGADGRVSHTERFSAPDVPIDQYDFTYDSSTKTTVTDPLGSVRSYNFQRSGGYALLTSQSQPGGSGCGPAANSIVYDSQSNPLSSRDFNGNTTCHFHAGNRNLETTRVEGLPSNYSCGGYATPGVTLPTNSRKISKQWHPDWPLEVRRAEPKRITTTVYNGQPDPTAGNAVASCAPATALLPDGKPIAVICKKVERETSDSNGTNAFAATLTGTARTWTYTYNQFGQVLTINGPRTDVLDKTTYTYHSATTAEVTKGDLATVTNALGHKISYPKYDRNGRVLQSVDANGIVTNFTYHPRGWLTSSQVGTELTTYKYDEAGQLKKVTLPDGSSSNYIYDNAHRLTSITNSAGEKIVYILDASGNRTSELTYGAGANGASTALNRQFDALGRLEKVLNAAAQETRVFAYDAEGNLTGETAKPDGQIVNGQPVNDQHTSYTYDTLDRLKTVTDTLNGLTQYGYDGLDHLTRVQDPNGHATTYTVNGLDTQGQETSPDRGTITRTFDGAGNVKTSTDARGKTTKYSYDALNRLTLETYADGTQTSYEYDQGTGARGRFSRITDATGTTAYFYNTLGRLIRKEQTTQHDTGSLLRTVRYAYDPATGRPNSLTYPSGAVLRYTYDAAGRPRSLTLTTNAVPATIILDNIAYRPQGPMRSYRLPAVTTSTGTHPTITRGYDGNQRVSSYTLADATKVLTYNRLDQVTKIGNQGTTANDQTYGYDQLNHLTGFDALPLGLSHDYGYDPVGNRTEKTVNGTSTLYTYDSASNRLAAVGATNYTLDDAGNVLDNGPMSFDYDARGRLANATTGAGVVYRYGINGLGQRVSKTSTALSTGGRVYIYDEAGHLLGEYYTGGGRVLEHVYLGDTPVAVIGGNGSVYYVLSDHLGTPRQIIDASKQLRWRWDPTDPFGANTPNANPAGLGSFTYNPRLPGQYFDAESGLHYNGFRDYHPGTGRYIESDPIGLAGGLNTYAYVGGNPINGIDPTGLLDEGEGDDGPDGPYTCPLISQTFLFFKYGLSVWLCMYNCNTTCPGTYKNIIIEVQWDIAPHRGCYENIPKPK
jgi:RHS repeat-associated protein